MGYNMMSELYNLPNKPHRNEKGTGETAQPENQKHEALPYAAIMNRYSEITL